MQPVLRRTFVPLSFAGDGFNTKPIVNHNQFSTHDADNDNANYNCAEYYESGWWFNSCHGTNLNGQHTSTSGLAHGIVWKSFAGWEQLKFSEMKIRPIN